MTYRRLGQHFLADPGWRARIADTLRATPDDLWLEIGAGHGEMTTLLARTAARVIAVELDPRLVERLRGLAREWPNIEVLAGDILELDLARVGGPRLSRSPDSALSLLAGASRFKVYGNLPYYITSPILHRLFQHADRIDAIYVVIQLEVAARLVARPGGRQYGYLSALAQFYARPEIVLRIPPGAFRPQPKVTSALVGMRLPGERARLGVMDEASFLDFVKSCFARKRKTLLNNLRPVVGSERAEEALCASNLTPSTRAEQLSLAQLTDLYHRLDPSRPPPRPQD